MKRDRISGGIDLQLVCWHFGACVLGTSQFSGCHQSRHGRHCRHGLILGRLFDFHHHRIGLERHLHVALISLQSDLDELTLMFDKRNMHGAAKHILGDRINAGLLRAVFTFTDQAD